MKNTAHIHHDNIATPGAPVWRRRMRTPLTLGATRQQLIDQAAEMPASERGLYVSRRLTALDRALADEEAEALEEWLACEEMLGGRVKIGDYGDRTGGGSGQASPVPDIALARLAAHASAKLTMPAQHREALRMLEAMMRSREWSLAEAGRAHSRINLAHKRAERHFIAFVREASRHILSKKSLVRNSRSPA